MHSSKWASVLGLALLPWFGLHVSARQARQAPASAQIVRSWDQVLAEVSRLRADGREAAATTVLDTYVRTKPARWEPYVALAQALEKQARYAAAADVLRTGRTAAPDMPATFVLQLIQYDVQHVTESPALSRADAARALAEAGVVADELIKSRQQVRMALLAKSYALKIQAERVEQTDARRSAVMAESDRLANQSRFTNDDGSVIAKTAQDEWEELQVAGDAASGPSGPALEKFVAAHPDFAPARTSLARYYQGLGDAVVERTAAAAATRTRHYQTADAQLTRAAQLATDPIEAANVLNAEVELFGAARLNRPADAEARARAALARYPDQPMFFSTLAGVLAPSSTIPTDAAVRTLRDLATTMERRQFFGIFLWGAVDRNREMPRAVAASLLTEATAAFDAVLKAQPNDVSALTYKSVALRLRADRVEQDTARATSLRAEADKLAEQVKKLRAGRGPG